MKRILVAVLACMLFVSQAAAKTVRGTVKGPDGPLAGVIVSDGYGFVKTARDGSFRINTNKQARFVFVVTPSGFAAPFESGAPQFYLPIKGTRRFNFSLQRFGAGEDFSILAVSDPQMQNEKHKLRFCGRPLGDLTGTAARLSAERTTVGIALGDIAWNRLEMFSEYKKAIAGTGIPFPLDRFFREDYASELGDGDYPGAAEARPGKQPLEERAVVRDVEAVA